MQDGFSSILAGRISDGRSGGGENSAYRESGRRAAAGELKEIFVTGVNRF